MISLKGTLRKDAASGLIKIGDIAVNQSFLLGLFEPEIPEILMEKKEKTNERVIL